jgi:predicted HTH domain antitoxin
MDYFTIRDLRERTGDLTRSAENGGLSVVARHGTPLFIAVPFDDSTAMHGVKASLAIKLYQDEVISLGKAARLAEMSQEKFMEVLGTMGIPFLRYDPSELERELDALDS